MSCLIIGDSIAVGIAGALGALHPHDCDVRATVGASVEAVSAMLPQRRYRSVIVAVGSNDSTRELRVRLPDLRARLGGARVTWIYPYGRSVAWEIYAAAAERRASEAGIAGDGAAVAERPAQHLADQDRRRLHPETDDLDEQLDHPLLPVRPGHRQHPVARRLDVVQMLRGQPVAGHRSEEHTSELQSLMRISYAVFCLKKKKKTTTKLQTETKNKKQNYNKSHKI